jgi:ubiquitin-protein ligase
MAFFEADFYVEMILTVVISLTSVLTIDDGDDPLDSDAATFWMQLSPHL